MLSCTWDASMKDMNLTILSTLNWSHFSFIPLDINTIVTEVSKVTLQMNISMPIEVILGEYSKSSISAGDTSAQRSPWLISNNQSRQVSWWITGRILDSKASTKTVRDISHVRLLSVPVECPPGYYLDMNKNQTCQCSYQHKQQQLNGILSCDSETFTAKIRRGYWAGYHLSTEHQTPTDINLVTAQCPRHYCSVNEQEASLPNTSSITLLNKLFCSPVNRNGTLCGRCSDGYSVAINSIFYDCVNCSDWLSQHSWLTYVLTEYVPSTLLFCLVLFFDINLHSGTISSVIFKYLLY